MKSEVRVGVIGLGHWGPNHVRVFNECEGARVVVCADLSEARRNHIRKLHRDVETVTDVKEVLSRKDVDAVVVATPTSTHYSLAEAAILAGKHVLLEKPMCASLKEAEALNSLAKQKGIALMMGHVFVYNRGIQFIKDSVIRGDFGRMEYLDATRTNLGPIRPDVNVIQDLAVHELSIFDAIFGELPQWVSVAASRLIGTSREDVAFISMEYREVLTHVHVSWLHPQKIRMLTLVGDKRMVVWNDLDAAEPVRIYNKGVAEEPFYNSFGEFQLLLRDRDILIPKLNLEEPLKIQAQMFLQRLKSGMPTLSDAESGIRVMKALEAIQASLKDDGKRIYLR